MLRFLRAPIAVSAVACLLLAGCGSNDSGDSGGKKVFFLLPNTTTTRFEQRDAPAFEKYMKQLSPGTSVTVLNAAGDPDKQQDQVNDAITQGASAIVLVSADANLAAGSLATAEQAKVPVILYEHDAVGGPVDAQVSFDAHAVGVAQGKRAAELIAKMPGQGLKIARVKGNPGEYGTTQYQAGQDEFLKPLIDSGKITVVCDKNITNWDPVQGQAFAEDCLTKQNNGVDLFVTMNDGLAGGIIAALTSQNLVGKIPVTGGQDANLDAVQFVAQGKLDNTIFKNLDEQAKAAAQVTSSILKDDGAWKKQVNGELDNKFQKVPTVFLPVQNVTKDNIDIVVKAGFYTWQEICQGGETSEVCKAHV
ncbi:sugar ABC transporter substrate-binding protein [Cryptosporangium sp. NPDC048952]|uniref:ABC transporter substrate-binding protein n=1 Tax=Cryptosporangium sp. NPDC048952 TaxID=3363961 RepID=UPI00371DE0CA